MIIQIALGIVLGYFLIGLILQPIFWSIVWRLIVTYLCICLIVYIKEIDKLPEEYAICFLSVLTPLIILVILAGVYNNYKEKHKETTKDENKQ